MLWQEASAKSEDGRATRTSSDGRKVIVWSDGNGLIQILNKAMSTFQMGWRDAESHEIEGFTDWEPVMEKIDAD